MIKVIDIHNNTDSYRLERKKIQFFAYRFVIFLLFFTLFAGSTATGFNVYGQSNDTASLQENESPPTTPDTPLEGNAEISEQLISENTSSGSSSSGNDDESATPAEPKQTREDLSESQPDGDCLFDPSLPKCAPDENGNCPEGFGTNEDGQCFPFHERCPEGYHSHEDDETGRCIPDDVPCDPGYIMNPDYPSCDNKDRVCQDHPDLDNCKVDDDIANNLPYKSGYNHGCYDAKISDPSKRYINQPGKGGGYHTSEFMRGYNDGFESCYKDNDSSIPTNKGIFRVIVQVTNNSPQDISGGITVSIDHQPENIFKSAYGLYFHAGETVSKTFTFKSSDVPIGTEFEVNIDYGDDYNQYTFGENSPVKRPEIVNFTIP